MSDEPEAVSEVAGPVAASVVVPIDLNAIEADLRDVEATLDRLADGTYFSDESSLSDGPTEGAG
jgi:hypothetical protein